MEESKTGNINHYTLTKSLGQGSYGKVRLCELGTEQFAVKIFNKGRLRRKKEYIYDDDGMSVRTALDGVAQEIAVMKKMSSPNIVQLFEAIDDTNRDKLYLVLEYCELGQLMEWKESIKEFYYPWDASLSPLEDQMRHLIREILRGISYIHTQNIVHGDIKPQNILVKQDMSIKIADFGQATIFEGEDKQTRADGTVAFLAPECLLEEAFSGCAADIWSLGITFYVMIYKSLPFTYNSTAELFDAISNFELAFPEEPAVDERLKHLISRMLNKDPSQRATIQEILDDPWVNEGSDPLSQERHDVVEVTPDEIQNAITPIHGVFFAKHYGKKWLGKIKNHQTI